MRENKSKKFNFSLFEVSAQDGRGKTNYVAPLRLERHWLAPKKTKKFSGLYDRCPSSHYRSRRGQREKILLKPRKVEGEIVNKL